MCGCCIWSTCEYEASRRPRSKLIVKSLSPNSQCMYVLVIAHTWMRISKTNWLQCYFLLSASPAIPILYHVDRVRDGRTYATRAVRAVQNGRTVFVMLCSFQKPELDQPTYQWAMPLNVPRPEDCEFSHARAAKNIQNPNIHEAIRVYLSEYIQVHSSVKVHHCCNMTYL